MRSEGTTLRQPPRHQARARLTRTNPLAGDSAQAARQAKVAAIVQMRRQRATDSAQAARQARTPAPRRTTYGARSGLAAEAARQAQPTRAPGLSPHDLAILHGPHFFSS